MVGITWGGPGELCENYAARACCNHSMRTRSGSVGCLPAWVGGIRTTENVQVHVQSHLVHSQTGNKQASKDKNNITNFTSIGFAWGVSVQLLLVITQNSWVWMALMWTCHNFSAFLSSTPGSEGSKAIKTQLDPDLWGGKLLAVGVYRWWYILMTLLYSSWKTETWGISGIKKVKALL